jgi:hypothetical protein
MTSESKRHYRYILLQMRNILKVLLIAIVINMACSFSPTLAKASSQQDCGKAEDQVIQGDTPKSWGSFYRLFKRFGDCDDGAIGEGFSEDVAQLFSKQWAHLDALSRLTTADKAFEKFVLRHIDATLSEGELKAIANNSRLHCPVAEKHLCQSVQARVQSSLDELRNSLK